MKLNLRKILALSIILFFLIDGFFSKFNKLNKFKSRLKNHGKGKNKKCNPYKNGPAEWKTVEYANSKHFDDKYGVKRNQYFGDNEANSNVEYYYDRNGKKHSNNQLSEQSNRIGYDPRENPNYVYNGMLGYVDDRIYE